MRAVRVASTLQGKLDIVATIARGDAADLLEAIDLATGDRVAVKMLREGLASDPEAVLRFEREARIASTLRSKHAVRVVDCGVTEEHRPFIVTELLKGRTLAAELDQRRPLGVEETAGYLAQACDAMVEAHAAGIIHRDLKPSHLFLADTPAGVVLKVLDFGLAGITPREGEERLTVTQSVFGSPLYMSPESYRSAKDSDARSDVWSLGVVLYECLTGMLPFSGRTALDVGLAVTRHAFTLPSRIRPDLPRSVDVIVGRALKKKPEERYQSMRELLAALELLLPRGIAEEESSDIDEAGTRRISVPAPLRKPLASDPDSVDEPTQVTRKDPSLAPAPIADPDTSDVMTRIAGGAPAPLPQPVIAFDDIQEISTGDGVIELARDSDAEIDHALRRALPSHTDVIEGERPLPPAPKVEAEPPSSHRPPPASARPPLPSLPSPFREETTEGKLESPVSNPPAPPSSQAPPSAKRSESEHVWNPAPRRGSPWKTVAVAGGLVALAVGAYAFVTKSPGSAATPTASAPRTSAPAAEMDAPSSTATATATAAASAALSATATSVESAPIAAPSAEETASASSSASAAASIASAEPAVSATASATAAARPGKGHGKKRGGSGSYQPPGI